MVTAVESGTKMPNKTIGGGPSLTCTNEISTQIAHKCLDDTNTDSEETEPDLADRLAHEIKVQIAIADIIKRMKDVDEEVAVLRHDLEADITNERIVCCLAPTRQHFHRLGLATLELAKVVDQVKVDIQLPQTVYQVTGPLSQALALSTSISAAILVVYRTINMQFLQGEKDIDRRSCDKDGTTPRSDLSAELGILMETCDRVIEVVRRAVELLKGLHGNEVKAYLRDSSTTKSYNDNQSNRFRILWIMFAFLAFILFATKHYDNTTKIAQLADKLDHISSHGGGGVEIEDIGAQLRDLSARSDSHGLRLDNLWEAWEAANLDGKYRNSQAPDAAKMQSCSDFEKRLNKFQQDMIQLELEVKEARRHFHLVDIRLMRQLKRFAGREGLELEK